MATILGINCYETTSTIDIPKNMLNNYTLIIVAASKQGHAMIYMPKIQPKKKYVDQVLELLK